MTNKTLKVSGVALIIATVVLTSVTATVFAADDSPESGNQGEECPCGDCADGTCIPNNWDYSYDYAEPGAHGQATITEPSLTAAGNPVIGNQAEERPCGDDAGVDGTPYKWDYSYDYAEPGPHGRATITDPSLTVSGNPVVGNQGEECPNGDGAGVDGTPYKWDYSYDYAEPGPHGQVAITDLSLTVAGNPVNGNQAEECPCGDGTNGEDVPNDWDYSYDYAEPGPHGMQHNNSNK